MFFWPLSPGSAAGRWNWNLLDNRIATSGVWGCALLNCKAPHRFRSPLLSRTRSLLLLAAPPELTAISLFELREPQPVAFFASGGYDCLMKLSGRSVIFLLRSRTASNTPTLLRPLHRERYAARSLNILTYGMRNVQSAVQSGMGDFCASCALDIGRGKRSPFLSATFSGEQSGYNKPHRKFLGI